MKTYGNHLLIHQNDYKELLDVLGDLLNIPSILEESKKNKAVDETVDLIIRNKLRLKGKYMGLKEKL